MDLHEQEKAKYKKVWGHEEYGTVSPGEHYIVPFLQISGHPVNGYPKTMYEYGAGCGRPALFHTMAGIDVAMFDIADNCLDEHVKMAIGDKLIVANLWDLPADTEKREYGYCTDVMEHIPPERVEQVINEISRTSKRCFFSICLMEDHFGKGIDEVLHLTVRPFEWWRDLLGKYGYVINARDLIANGIYYVEWYNND
jgi:hypothetical protein